LNALKNIIIIFFSGVIFTSIFLFGLFIYVSYDLPKISSLSDYNPPIPSRIYTKDKKLLLEIGKERRSIVAFDQIPKRVLNAFLSAEDDNFYNHKGVDYFGLARAMLANLKAGRVVQGGSTITQQVAKSLLLSREKTIARKMRDFLLAIKIEEKFTKEEILYLYLNQVYLGGGYYGIRTAFKGYFNKDLEQATVAECALIAGLLVAPGKYSPYVNPLRAKQRQGYVLKRMFDTGKITEIEYKNAKQEEIKILKKDPFVMLGGHFTDWIRQRVMDQVGAENFLNNGFEVYTTLDYSLQEKAEVLIKASTEELDRRQGFKGPIKNISSTEITNFEIEQRKFLFENKSGFFSFRPDGTVVDEYANDLNEFTKRDTLNSFKTLKPHERKYAVIGNPEKDEAKKILDLQKNFQAVVLQVSDQMRIVFASVGGARVFIPYDGYKWAHERINTEEPKYFPFVQNPSSFLKAGDIIWLKIQKHDQVVWNYIFDKFKKTPNLQSLESFYKEQKFHLASLEQEAEAEGALFSLNPNNSEIVAMVGGKNFEKSQFNRVIQANRQPGSAFKPFIYATALENGFTPSSILIDSPQALGGVDSNLDWKPRNYDGEFLGEMTFRRALETSRNIPTIKLLQDLGVDKVLSFSKRIQLNAQMPQDLSVSLGSFGVSLFELVKAYSIFPNGGKILFPKSILSIKDRFGNNYNLKDEIKLIEDPKLNSKQTQNNTDSNNENKPDGVKQNIFHMNLNANQVYDSRLSYLMSNILRGVINSGTGIAAKGIGTAIAGKTGTTNSYVDAWFIGFSPGVVTGVWVGMDNNLTMGFGETGARSALPVWRDFMQLAIKKYGDDEFNQPEGIVNVSINSKTGKIARPGDKLTMVESFALGTEPGSTSAIQETDESNPSIIIDDDDYYSNQ
jgi:penicillin-binding protein 1A